MNKVTGNFWTKFSLRHSDMSFFFVFFLTPPSSSSSSSSSSLRFSGLIFTVFLFLVSFLINVEGFEPLLQFPHSLAASPRLQREKVLYVNKLGAKGDGVQDDTDVIFSPFFFCFFFFFFFFRGEMMV